jgi:phospholipase C
MTVAARGLSDPALHYRTETPIKHVIVIFWENESSDHFFGTYPYAANPSGETPLIAARTERVSSSMPFCNPSG